MRISWITLNQPQTAPDRSLTSDLASLRLRVLSPIKTLGHAAFAHRIFSLTSDPADPADPVRAEALKAEVMIFSKSLLASNEDLARRATAAGVKVVFDLCDDHFADPHLGAHYRTMCALADQVVCNSPQMAALAEPFCANPPLVIDDPYEGARRPARFDPATPLRLLWFGSPLNLESLNAAFPDLVELSTRQPLSLTLLTQPSEPLAASCRRFSEKYGPALTTSTLSWSLPAQSTALAACDAVIIPTLPTAKYRAKSANRMVEALWAGRPVVAQPIPAYSPFADWTPVTDKLSDGIMRLMGGGSSVVTAIDAAQTYIEDRHAPVRLGAKWKQMIETLVQAGGRREA